MWECQRNDASGEEYSTKQAMNHGRVKTDVSGQVFSTYQAMDCRTARTDTSGQVFSTYQAKDRGRVSGKFPLAGILQIDP